MPGPRIMIVSSTMTDLVSYLDRMPDRGETVFGKDFAQGFGGKGANQAVMAALLGAQVTMVCAVGTDSFGRDTIENFRSSGIGTDFIVEVDDTHSGLAMILVDPDGDNRIVLAPGANELLTPDHVDAAFDGSPAPDLVLSQLEVPQETICRGFERARRSGATTVLNPAPAAPVDPELLRVTDWVVPNETELAILLEAETGRTVGDLEADALTFADRIDASLVVTLGERGALLVRDGVAERFEAPAVRAVDTTGAGDAFCGGFAYALAGGASPADAIRLGTTLASDSVTRRGTQASYARGEGLDRLLERS
ncbi:ribokinase [Georgenia sp. Z1491]|uniref:ribokinase n=1 Tax=Georgenia sp. Z1491 TaxID=3416707 RepID=UPI003CE7C851